MAAEIIIMKVSNMLLIPLLVLAAGCIQQGEEPVACTQDAKLCPDGSYVSRMPPSCDFTPCPPAENNGTEPPKNYCSPEQRQADFCVQLYQPVCAWFDPAKVQCVKYPCATTQSNSCFACQNPDVLYWTEGECPK